MSGESRVLVLCYSQTGRTKQAVDAFLHPLREDPDVQLVEAPIEMQTPFPYPWPLLEVLSMFPETVLEQPLPLRRLPVAGNGPYDLIVLGCQVWFLSCSLPVSSLFRAPESRVFAATPVVPVLTFRKAWREGLDSVEQHLHRLGADILGRVVIQARDEDTLPLLRMMKYEPRPAGRRDWRFDEEALRQVDEAGRQTASFLRSRRARASPAAGVDAAFAVLPRSPPPDQMTTEQMLIARYEAAQKRSYLRWGRVIRRHSAPHTSWRKTVIVALAPFYLPLVYWRAPLTILRRWLTRSARGAVKADSGKASP